MQTSVRSSPPHVPWTSASSWNSRRSSWNSLGRAPSLKRQKRQSGERRSLLSADGQSSSEEEEVSGADGAGGGERMSECDDASLSRTDSFGQQAQHRRMESVETRSSLDLPPDTLQVPYLHRSASIHSAWPPLPQHTAAQDCNGKSSPSAATNQLSLDEHHSEDENVEEEGNMVNVLYISENCEVSGHTGHWNKMNNLLFVPMSNVYVWMELLCSAT